ncbi:MAG: hypothetical protein M3119_05240 [Verrucomicrobiota bacterium]|nr:hypothetical protein [Verrucomicrobiota bacterium]MDQ6939545.1 hypothetical protein [Verrucomicrobiota bacterium]
MKLKLSLAALLASGSMVMVFAAGKVETCAEKYSHCSETCTNEQYHCKTSGVDPTNCEVRFKTCMKKCDKAKADCEKNTKK